MEFVKAPKRKFKEREFITVTLYETLVDAVLFDRETGKQRLQKCRFYTRKPCKDSEEARVLCKPAVKGNVYVLDVAIACIIERRYAMDINTFLTHSTECV